MVKQKKVEMDQNGTKLVKMGQLGENGVKLGKKQVKNDHNWSKRVITGQMGLGAHSVKI